MASYYYVEENNWTDILKGEYNTTIYPSDNEQTGVYTYNIPGDGTSADPAIDCLKSFKVNYRCGSIDSSEKKIDIPNAGYNGGKTVTFDCSESYEKCNDIKLTLDNDGSLTLTSGSEKLWDNKNSIDVLKMKSDMESGLLVAFISDISQNYIIGGEQIEKNKYIISPNKMFKLILNDIPLEKTTGGPKLNRSALYVTYQMLGCGLETQEILDPSAARLYTINDSTSKSNIGSVGYVNELGQLISYPTDSIAYNSTDYEKIGNYGLFNSADLSASMQTSVDECIKACNNFNGDSITSQQCAGFVYEKVGKVCRLKNKFQVFTGNRFINDNYEYYVRNKGIVGGWDPSCRTDTIQTGSQLLWRDVSSGVMSPTNKCGLEKYIVNEERAVNIVDASLNGLKTILYELKNTFLTKFNRIKDRINSFNENADIYLNDLQNSRKELGDWTGKQLKQLEAMDEDRDLNMMSQNYKHIIWSILAIIIIIIAMGITRNVTTEI